MKFIIGLMAMLLPILCGAQSPPVKALNIGDTVPDIVLTNVYNYPDSVIRLSDLRGKLVILDFWATWCGSCVKVFSKMDSLQKEYKDELQIIMINSITGTGDSIMKVKNFIKEWMSANNEEFALPIVAGDTLAKKFFPRTYLPHYVWIGVDGKVSAITSSKEVSVTNILRVLKYPDYKLPLKEQ